MKFLTDINISGLVIKQLSNFFPINNLEKEIIELSIWSVLSRVRKCFAGVDNKYFKDGNEVLFNPYHSGQWLIFLYFLSNFISMSKSIDLEKYGNREITLLADKIYYLNKILNAVDIFHQVNLPEVFFLEHPVGTVLGRAQYGNNFFCMQGCSVGGTINKNGRIEYPVIEENVKMYAHSSILGACHIGKNVKIGAGALIKNENIPQDSIVFGQSPNLIIKNVQKISY